MIVQQSKPSDISMEVCIQLFEARLKTVSILLIGLILFISGTGCASVDDRVITPFRPYRVVGLLPQGTNLVFVGSGFVTHSETPLKRFKPQLGVAQLSPQRVGFTNIASGPVEFPLRASAGRHSGSVSGVLGAVTLGLAGKRATFQISEFTDAKTYKADGDLFSALAVSANGRAFIRPEHYRAVTGGNSSDSPIYIRMAEAVHTAKGMKVFVSTSNAAKLRAQPTATLGDILVAVTFDSGNENTAFLTFEHGQERVIGFTPVHYRIDRSDTLLHGSIEKLSY
jgi:hypothetical protein